MMILYTKECANGPRNATRRNYQNKGNLETSSSQSVEEWPSLALSQPPTLRSCASSVKRREPTLTFFTWLPPYVLAQLSRKPSKRFGMTDFMSNFARHSNQKIHMQLISDAIRDAGLLMSPTSITKDHKTKQSMIDELCAQIEFLSLVECTLLDGKMAGIVVLQEVYNSIPPANNVKNPNCNRKKWNNA